MNTFDLPSQFVPVYPMGQSQVYDVWKLVQVAPFWQGSGSHKSMAVK